MVQRTGLAVSAALQVALATGFTLRALYGAGYVAVDVSDGEGHGPDEGSAEWRHAVQRAVPWRATKAGALAGVICFFVVFRALRPRTISPGSGGHPTDRTQRACVFTFQPRWKEELVCACSRGSFLLELPASTAMRYTALLVLSEQEAYLAGSEQRVPCGPNGEWHLARLLHTIDAGRHWQTLPWHRTLRSRLRHPGFPNWPPEFVLGIHQTDGQMVLTHRDEWVPFEPGGESLWEASFDGRSWRVRCCKRRSIRTTSSCLWASS